MRNPCHKCDERTEHCHATCERYEIYREAMDTRNEKIRAGKEKYEFTQSVIVESCTRTTHKKPGRY